MTESENLRRCRVGDQGNACGAGWVDERVSESIHGQWRTHSWELSEQEFSYDKAGRLTEVVDDVVAPVGVAGCSIRSYSFDLNSNRTALNTKAPDSNGDCQPGAAGATDSYSHDSADRLTGSGLVYDSFGRMTSIPAEHSGGGVLSYGYYVDDQVRTISQDGVSKTYTLDPAGRHQRTETSDGATHTETLLYAGGSDSPAVTVVADDQANIVSAQRYVEGIDGDLAAIRTADYDAETDETVLQLSNLHGDTIATASLDPQATQPLDRFETDEFGNPRQAAGADKRYGYLGGKQRRTELASGVTQMGVRSYVPGLGRFTSIDPIEGGSANDYDYVNQDPGNQFDFDGRCVFDPDWIKPKIVRKKKFTYVEICRKNGRRAGYVRFRNSKERRIARSPGGAVVKRLAAGVFRTISRDKRIQGCVTWIPYGVPLAPFTGGDSIALACIAGMLVAQAVPSP